MNNGHRFRPEQYPPSRRRYVVHAHPDDWFWTLVILALILGGLRLLFIVFEWIS